jgi:hypothetical protein
MYLIKTKSKNLPLFLSGFGRIFCHIDKGESLLFEEMNSSAGFQSMAERRTGKDQDQER